MDGEVKRARDLFVGINWSELEESEARKRLVEFHRPCLECGIPVEDDDNQRCNICKIARKEDLYE